MGAYYHTCPECGANLDPGERCDCRREQLLVTITLDDGDEISTRFNGSFEDVMRYYSPASLLNVGTGPRDAYKRITGLEIKRIS